MDIFKNVKITKKIKDLCLQSILWKIKAGNGTCIWNKNEDETFQEYKKYVSDNRNVEYTVEMIPIKKSEQNFKWVGGQIEKKCLYGIVNGEMYFLKYSLSDKSVQYYGKFSSAPFKWTGGCIWKGNLYGFPRSAASLLRLDLNSQNIYEIPLKIDASKEHHYGGVCSDKGLVYQPPRDTDNILVLDLNLETARKIQLAPKKWKIRFRYCGSIIHPNGYAYFFPEHKGRVIKLNLETEKWSFIGKTISTMVFDAKVAVDGNIYGYSAYCPGMLKINVTDNSCEMIHIEESFGAYGTKLGINGRLYSIPGDGSCIWEYNPVVDELRKILDLHDEKKAKFAGGAITEQGDIFAIPAQENCICHLISTETNLIIPKQVMLRYFNDNY